jgi:hypothetical protein
MTIQEMAKMINEDSVKFNYLPAYRLLCETYSIWVKEDNKKYLNESSLNLLECAEDDPKTIK